MRKSTILYDGGCKGRCRGKGKTGGRAKSKVSGRRSRKAPPKSGDAVEAETRPRKSSMPPTRAHCANGPRPCPWVGCKYHLYLDVNQDTGTIRFNFPDKEIWELEHTCALDLADEGELTLDQIGDVMNLTRERVRQVACAVLARMYTEIMGEDSPRGSTLPIEDRLLD